MPFEIWDTRYVIKINKIPGIKAYLPWTCSALAPKNVINKIIIKKINKYIKSLSFLNKLNENLIINKKKVTIRKINKKIFKETKMLLYKKWVKSLPKKLLMIIL